jgi:hypothetical protein
MELAERQVVPELIRWFPVVELAKQLDVMD